MKHPKISQDTLVKITLPPITVKISDAKYFLEAFNEFASHLRNHLVSDLFKDAKIYEMDSVYHKGEFIPICLVKTNLNEVLKLNTPMVDQYDKYVYLEAENYIGSKDQIVECWENYQESKKAQQ